jgi:hypothetical protein
VAFQASQQGGGVARIVTKQVRIKPSLKCKLNLRALLFEKELWVVGTSSSNEVLLSLGWKKYSLLERHVARRYASFISIPIFV